MTVRALRPTVSALLLSALVGCAAHERARTVALGPAPVLPETKRARRQTPLPEWFWEPVDVEMRTPRAAEAPADEAAVTRIEGATRLWDELPRGSKDRLLKDGVLVLGDDRPSRDAAHERARSEIGAFYAELREARTPYVITVEALFSVVRLAFEKMQAEIEETKVQPALSLLLGKLATRLGAEQRQPATELVAPLRMLRGVVAVASALAFPDRPVPRDLAAVVAQELALVEQHAGATTSPLLGVPVDYAGFAPPAATAKPGMFRALTWLASAPFVLLGKGEELDVGWDVTTARRHTRAAMLLARLVDREVDPEIYGAWLRIAKLYAFFWGPPDDLAPPELADAASGTQVDLANPANVASVVKVDRLRHRASSLRRSQVFDGNAVAGRGGASMRIVGGRAPADSLALGAFVGLAFGKPTANPPAWNARGGVRVVPSTLDLGVWLGASEARKALRETGADGFDKFDAAFDKLLAARLPEDAPQRHASVHGSLLDALSVYASTPRGTVALERCKLESVLSSWTMLRHAGTPLVHKAKPKGPPREIRVSGAPLPAFVEPAPETVARLLATVRQLRRGVAALNAKDPSTAHVDASSASPGRADAMAAEVEDILTVALRVAAQAVNDDPVSTDDASALAAMPARLAALEAEADNPRVAVAAEVFHDLRGGRTLVSATGAIETALFLVPSAASKDGPRTSTLVVGAHVAHHELIEARGVRLTDADWRKRAMGAASSAGARSPYVSSFRVTR